MSEETVSRKNELPLCGGSGNRKLHACASAGGIKEEMFGFLAIIGISISLTLFRVFAPRDPRAEEVVDNGNRLPYGVAGAIMWMIGVTVAVGGFFLFYWANRYWASFDQKAELILHPPSIIWCFAPGFAALLIPWLSVLWLLRRFNYVGQAAAIVAQGNDKINVNGEKVMHGLGWLVVLPIFLLTVPEIPAHLSVVNDQVRVAHYGHIKPNIYPLAEAKKAWWVDGYVLRDGSFKSKPDLLIDFADGRRLRATAMSDGGAPPPQRLVDLVLSHTGLHPTHVRTEDEVPK